MSTRNQTPHKKWLNVTVTYDFSVSRYKDKWMNWKGHIEIAWTNSVLLFGDLKQMFIPQICKAKSFKDIYAHFLFG